MTPMTRATKPPATTAAKHRPPMVVGELSRRQCSDTGEGDLAQPEHAAFSGGDRPGQEDHAVGEGLGYQTAPSTPGR